MPERHQLKTMQAMHESVLNRGFDLRILPQSYNNLFRFSSPLHRCRILAELILIRNRIRVHLKGVGRKWDDLSLHQRKDAWRSWCEIHENKRKTEQGEIFGDTRKRQAELDQLEARIDRSILIAKQRQEERRKEQERKKAEEISPASSSQTLEASVSSMEQGATDTNTQGAPQDLNTTNQSVPIIHTPPAPRAVSPVAQTTAGGEQRVNQTPQFVHRLPGQRATIPIEQDRTQGMQEVRYSVDSTHRLETIPNGQSTTSPVRQGLFQASRAVTCFSNTRGRAPVVQRPSTKVQQEETDEVDWNGMMPPPIVQDTSLRTIDWLTPWALQDHDHSPPVGSKLRHCTLAEPMELW